MCEPSFKGYNIFFFELFLLCTFVTAPKAELRPKITKEINSSLKKKKNFVAIFTFNPQLSPVQYLFSATRWPRSKGQHHSTHILLAQAVLDQPLPVSGQWKQEQHSNELISLSLCFISLLLVFHKIKLILLLLLSHPLHPCVLLSWVDVIWLSSHLHVTPWSAVMWSATTSGTLWSL